MNIYISDLDGTLLNSKGFLHTKDKKDINTFYQNKIYFSIATARSIVTIKEALGNHLQFHLPIIEYNGAYITDYSTNEILWMEFIDKETLGAIFTESKKLNIAQITAGHTKKEKNPDKRYFCHINKINNRGLEDFYQDRLSSNDKRITFDKNIFSEENIVVGLTFIDTKEKLTPLVKIIEEKYINKLNYYLLQDQYKDKKYFWLLVQSKQATKANGIKKIIDLKQLEQYPYHLSVFGDNFNDIEMFDLSHKAIAPSNAMDKVKQLADEVIGHHSESAVVNYIKEREALKLDRLDG